MMTKHYSTGKWAKIGDLIKAPTTPPPADLFWECEECGPIEPFATPWGSWIRRSCPCQRQARREQEESKRRIAWLAEQRTHTFGGWLGKQWINHGAIQQLDACRFESYDASRFPLAYQKALEFAQHPRGNLIFYGWYGVGKTHLEAAIANHLREAEMPTSCLFTSAPLFFMAYEEARKSDGPLDHHTLLRRAMSAAVLILDDVDKCRHSEAREDVYYTLIDERYKSGKPTVLSLNELDDLPRHIGQAAFSRISCGLVAIKMVGGTDYRQEQM